MKKLIIISTLLTSLTASAQVNINFGAGIISSSFLQNKVVTHTLYPFLKLSVGYQFKNNINAEIVEMPSITRQSDASNFFGLKAGYNYHNLIPSVGYYLNYKSADNNSLNKWYPGISLKYLISIINNDNGTLYIEGNYINKTYSLNGGFNIKF